MAGGGTIETTNGRVTGTIVYPDGNPAPGSQVKLVPGNYDPVKGAAVIPVDTTDESGRYVFKGVSYGVYTIQSVQCIDRTRAIAFGISLNQSAISLASIELQRPGTITVMLPSGFSGVNGYVYIPGSDIAGFLKQTGDSVTLDSVPAGKVPAVDYASKSDTVFNVIRYNVRVLSGDTVTIHNPSWLYAGRLTLNTTASGANVAGAVTDFPAAVRLTRSNFDFTQAQAGGGDIRFTKSDNTPLPYEIERWDPVNGFAEIWVKVDTVFGNDSTHVVTMYWGNSTSSVTSQSNGAMVFDTTDGWAGVWHLPENAPDTITPALYRNSVENANYGDDKVLSSGKTGVIGLGQNFTWLTKASIVPGDRIQVPNASARLKPQQLTLSGWMQVFQSDSSGSEMASMGDNYLIRVDNFGRVRFVVYSSSAQHYAACWDSSANFVDSSWHFYAGTCDGAEARLYVDGVLRSTEVFTAPIDYTRGPDFVMGSHGSHQSGFDLNGNLDEIECSSAVRSADWIKLMYENQRINGKFISTAP